MLRIYQRLWQVNWAEQWQYRANLLMYLLYWLVSPIVYLSVWTTVAGRQGTVGGLSAADFVTYYLVLLLVDSATSEITIHLLAYLILGGSWIPPQQLPCCHNHSRSAESTLQCMRFLKCILQWM